MSETTMATAIPESCDWPEADWLAPHFRKEIAACRTMRDLRATVESILGCVESLRARVRADREKLAAPPATAGEREEFVRQIPGIALWLCEMADRVQGVAPGDPEALRSLASHLRAIATAPVVLWAKDETDERCDFDNGDVDLSNVYCQGCGASPDGGTYCPPACRVQFRPAPASAAPVAHHFACRPGECICGADERGVPGAADARARLHDGSAA